MSELKGAMIIGQSGGPSSVINASCYGAIKAGLDSDVITKVYGAANGIVGVSQGHNVMVNTLIYAALPEFYAILALLTSILLPV